MEILKFDEGDTKPKSRKFSSRGSILVAAVAIMFGASTALAGSTLTINTANQIEP
jgi:fructose-1,6-bisphosphatase